MKKNIKSDNAPSAIGPYSQGIISGDFVFLSGQIPLDIKGNIVSDDIVEQAKQCLANIENVLKVAGLTKNNIVKTTIFLTDLNDFAKVNEVYGKFFENTVYPARSTIEVSKLPKGAKIEIEVIACRE